MRPHDPRHPRRREGEDDQGGHTELSAATSVIEEKGAVGSVQPPPSIPAAIGDHSDGWPKLASSSVTPSACLNFPRAPEEEDSAKQVSPLVAAQQVSLAEAASTAGWGRFDFLTLLHRAFVCTTAS